jgi:hypothetical protein
MSNLSEEASVEELGETAKAEKEAFEAARREVSSWDQRSAVHYYRLGHALHMAKEKLGRGVGRPGNFRAWHVRLGINQNTASRAMRLYEAGFDDGGEDSLAGLGWWAALKHYGIISDDKMAEKQGERPNYWDSPDRGYASGDNEVEHDADDLPPPTGTTMPTFGDIALIGGFRSFLIRHLVALGATEAQAESILKEEYEAIHTSLMEALKEKLSELVEAKAASGADADEPF